MSKNGIISTTSGLYTKVAVNNSQERTLNLFTTMFFKKWDMLHIQVRAEKKDSNVTIGKGSTFSMFLIGMVMLIIFTYRKWSIKRPGAYYNSHSN